MTRTLFLFALLASPLAAQDSIRSYRVMRSAETDSTVSYFTRIVTPPPVHDTVTIRDTLRLYWNGTAWSTTATIPPSSVAPCEGVQVATGESIQAASTAAGTGDTLCLLPGIHRHQSVTPKQGQTFLGVPGQTILTGAKVLTGPWTQSGTTWWTGNQTQQNTDYGNSPCAAGHPGCIHPEQLWVDGTLYEHVTTLAAAGAGKWYFDYAADRIYIPTNPSGKMIETSVTVYAFSGSVSGVTVKNLTIEKYANGSQRAAVGYGGSAQNWVVDSNIVRHNHGVGIRTGSGSRQKGNVVKHQGQVGVMASGAGVLIYGNTIDSNMVAFFGSGSAVECGATKFVSTTSGLIVRKNIIRWNGCMALWLDVNNRGALVDSNTVNDNACNGIFDEVGYNTIIRHNTVERNGLWCTLGPSAVTPAGIAVSNNPNSEVYENTVRDNLHGITGYESDRTYPPIPSGFGAHHLTDLSVHDNVIRQTNGGRAAGVIDLDPNADPYSAGSNNVFADNDYTCASSTKWRWSGGDKTRAQWLALPQDAGSTFTGC